MPHWIRILFKALLPVSLLVMAILAIVRREPDAWEYERAEEEQHDSAGAPRAVARRRPAARFALAAAFTTLFFAGAAFTAGAGDRAVRMLDEDAVALEAESPAPDAAAANAMAPEPVPDAAPEAAPEVAPAPEPAPAAEAPEAEVVEPSAPQAAPAPAPAPEDSPAVEPAPAAAAAPAAESDGEPQPSNISAPAAPAAPAASTPSSPQADAGSAGKPAPAKAKATRKWVVRRAAAPPARAPEVEHEAGGEPTIWLNRSLPDPTPASARLTRRFAKQLASASRRHGADWAAVLGVLRAQGERGSVPATARELDALARRMAGTNAWKGALALSGRTGFADRAAAFADLYRFTGIEALVTGYAAAKDRLARKLLSTEGVLIYDGGRSDIHAGRIDVRVIVLVGYLAQRHGSVTVSSLFSGHRKFARPGVVSAHVYGHAVDIAAVGGTAIAGHQQPGGLTEAAVRSVLLLPGELQPQQVISLLGLGGPSFPMRDHGDHIHVGY